MPPGTGFYTTSQKTAILGSSLVDKLFTIVAPLWSIYLDMYSGPIIFVRKKDDMGEVRLPKGMDTIKMNFRIEKPVYERLLKLKIAEMDSGSFNKFLNKKLAQVVVANRVLIDGYEVDHENSDF